MRHAGPDGHDAIGDLGPSPLPKVGDGATSDCCRGFVAAPPPEWQYFPLCQSQLPPVIAHAHIARKSALFALGGRFIFNMARARRSAAIRGRKARHALVKSFGCRLDWIEVAHLPAADGSGDVRDQRRF